MCILTSYCWPTDYRMEKSHLSEQLEQKELHLHGLLCKWLKYWSWDVYAAAQVNTISKIKQILCELTDSLPLMFILHPQQWCATRTKPNEINQMTARMKAAAPVNPTDCMHDDEKIRYINVQYFGHFRSLQSDHK